MVRPDGPAHYRLDGPVWGDVAAGESGAGIFLVWPAQIFSRPQPGPGFGDPNH